MQGRVAGVQITQSSGEPGGGINVRIRGTSSVFGGNNPLFVIDGVPLADVYKRQVMSNRYFSVVSNRKHLL